MTQVCGVFANRVLLSSSGGQTGAITIPSINFWGFHMEQLTNNLQKGAHTWHWALQWIIYGIWGSTVPLTSFKLILYVYTYAF